MKKLKLFTVILTILAAMFAIDGQAQAEVKSRMSGKTLTLIGDSFADEVVIVGFSHNQVTVEVNGGPVMIWGGVENIKVNMKKGADSLEIRGIEISGNLEIDMGGDIGDFSFLQSSPIINTSIGGNYTNKGSSDSMTIDSIVGKNVTITAGVPFDLNNDIATIHVENVIVTGNTAIMGDDRDKVGVWDSLFANDLTINMGSGRDELAIYDNTVGRNLTMNGGTGFNTMVSGGNVVNGKTILKKFEP